MKIFSWKIPVLSLELCDPFWVNSAVVRKSQPFFAYRCTIALIPFLKKNSFSTEMLMHLSQRSVGHICVGLVMGFLSCSVDLCLFLCQYCTSISLWVLAWPFGLIFEVRVFQLKLAERLWALSFGNRSCFTETASSTVSIFFRNRGTSMETQNVSGLASLGPRYFLRIGWYHLASCLTWVVRAVLKLSPYRKTCELFSAFSYLNILRVSSL